MTYELLSSCQPKLKINFSSKVLGIDFRVISFPDKLVKMALYNLILSNKNRLSHSNRQTDKKYLPELDDFLTK
jgi:hypothetical protein